MKADLSQVVVPAEGLQRGAGLTSFVVPDQEPERSSTSLKWLLWLKLSG